VKFVHLLQVYLVCSMALQALEPPALQGLICVKLLHSLGLLNSFRLLEPHPKSDTICPSICHCGFTTSSNRLPPLALAMAFSCGSILAVGRTTAAMLSLSQAPTQSVSSSHCTSSRPCHNIMHSQHHEVIHLPFHVTEEP